MSVGRNDPCPCGSGRKHKHCCLARAAAAADGEASLQLWQRLRREGQGFPSRMLNFIGTNYGRDVVHEAWDEFVLWDENDDGFEADSPELPLFMPWMFHRWAPDPYGTEVADAALHDIEPTRLYLARKGRQLDPMFRAYLEACLDADFSFFEIVRCEPGQGFEARELLSGALRQVREQSASRTLRPGDMIYGQLVPVADFWMLEACSTVVFPPERKLDVMRLRSSPRASARDPADRDWRLDRDDFLREHYLALREELLDPPRPVLHNTDGDPLEPQRLRFRVDSAQLAAERLMPLALVRTLDEILRDAQRDAAGAIERVAFDWLQSSHRSSPAFDNVVLGRFEIAGHELTLHVNSRARAERGRDEVEKALGATARYVATEVEPLDLEQAAPPLHPGAARASPANDPDGPEVAALVEQMLARHYETWPDTPLPALGGLTPLQAVQSREGREMVEALVAQIERGRSGAVPIASTAVVQSLRRRLGLDGGGA